MSIVKPFIFTAGTKARANEVNDNFDVLYSQVNSNITAIENNAEDIDELTLNKANINGNSTQRFAVADPVTNTDAINKGYLLTSGLPTGFILYHGGASAPTGYLLCNGSAVSRSSYSALFGVIGTRFGAGDGSTTFNIPDLIGRFAEGSSVAGAYKNAGLPNISGWFRVASEYGYSDSDNTLFQRWSDGKRNNGIENGGTAISFNASRVNSIYGGSTTVQPKSLTLLPIIKY